MPELKAISKLTHNLVAIEVKTDIGEVMTCADYSSLSRLFRVTAYVLRAVNCFKSKKSDVRHTTTLTPPEIATAEKLWVGHAQRELALQEFDAMKGQFDLFLDDKGLWRCGGRLQNADLPFDTKRPIMLPRKHPLTTLIVLDAHQRVGHNGVKETLTEVRRRYWVVKGRSLV